MTFKRKNANLLTVLVLVFVFVAIFLVPTANSRYKYDRNGNSDIDIAKFQVKLNNSTDLEQSIDLKDTITSNNYSDDYVMPGATGDIVLALDFSSVEVSTNYAINLGTCDLPDNLKLYSDSNFTNEFTSISGTFLINSTSSYTHHIYWKWEYATDSTSDSNDNLYMNQNLSVPVVVTTSQRIGSGS